MMMRGLLLSAFLALMTSAVQAGAWIEPEIRQTSSYCGSIENATSLLDLDDATLRSEVTWRYEQAVEASMSQNVIYSTSTRFNWANEAKTSCAKVLGFLNHWGRGWKYRKMCIELVQQCECFHRRMGSW